MKLVQKLTLALIVGITVVLAINGYFRVRREVALFQSDRVRDHQLVGRALGASFAALWRAEGEARARAMLAQVGAREEQLGIRWVPDARADDEEPVTRVVTDPDGRAFRRTFVPVTIGDPQRVPHDPPIVGAPGAPSGGLLISESLAAERGYVRTTVIDTVVTTALLALVSAALSATLGAWFVGRPVHALAAKARRVGQGDFSSPLHLRQRDELAELAVEMNSMCDRLVEAHERSAAEAAARITALEQLRHADRLMTVGKLASGIAHELGTPLNVVSARAGMIADGETTPAESVAYAQIIAQACDQMTRIIRQLLDFARPRGPERTAEDVRQIVQRTLTLLEPMAAKRSVTLDLAGEEVAVSADVDAGQMQQVFTNLVANAIQAMSSPGKVDVTVSRRRAIAPKDLGGAEAECVVVAVRDEGSGILPEHLPHVFEPFFTTKDVGQGTGLGLSVAYGIVREHGGWMDVRSEPGRGSEFTVHLPVKEG